MKKIQLIYVALILSLTSVPQARGQFDLGNVFRDEIRQEVQQIRGEIQGAVGGAIQDWRNGGPIQTLPYPPQQTLPYYPPQQTLPYPPQQTLPYPPQQTLPYPPQQTLPYYPPQQDYSCPHSQPQVYPPYNPALPQPDLASSQPMAPHFAQTIMQTSSPQPQSEAVDSESEFALPEVEAGQLVSIDGVGFGIEPGAVNVVIGEMILSAELVEWTDTEVSAVLPRLPMTGSVQAIVAVVTSQQEVAERLEVQMLPASADAPAFADDAGNEDDVETEEELTAEELELPVVELGTELALEGEAMGDAAGSANLLVGSVTHRVSVIRWSATEVTIQMPAMDLTEPTEGNLKLLDATGKLVSEFDVLLVNKNN